MEKEIVLKYKTLAQEQIRIFGKKFVINNKNNCKIKINNIEQNITEYYCNEKNENEFIIKLSIINEIKDMSYMFDECKNLLSIDNFDLLDTSKVTNMSCMFLECESLISISDISNWDTSNVTNLRFLFFSCLLIWNTCFVNVKIH